jgi:S-adenosylmethionine decarboxylase
VGTDAEAVSAGADVNSPRNDGVLPGKFHDQVGKDYFVSRDGVSYAGSHLIIDLWGGTKLDDLDHVEQTLRQMADAAGATLLHIHLHHFSPNGGISGVAVLAESHITIHTWPERGYAALDAFMCGACDPRDTLPVLRRMFLPTGISVGEHLRGRTD